MNVFKLEINPKKAVRVLGWAYKCLARTYMNDEKLLEEILPQLKNKMELMKKFVTARRYVFH